MAESAPKRRRAADALGGVSFHFDPKTPVQREAVEAYDNSDVLFFVGAAGTGKSHTAVALALRALLEGRQERILVTRPIVEAGEHLGFLPGSVADKTEPYRVPVADVLSNMLFANHARQAMEKIQFTPLAYLRGVTFKSTVAILDEAQNATVSQFRLFLSRLGQDSTIIVTGDPDQSDLPPGKSGLASVVERLRGLARVAVVEFPVQQTVRHPLVADMLERLA